MKAIAIIIECKSYVEDFSELCELIEKAINDHNKYALAEVRGHQATTDGYGNANIEFYFNSAKVSYRQIKSMIESFYEYVICHHCKIEIETKELPNLKK